MNISSEHEGGGIRRLPPSKCSIISAGWISGNGTSPIENNSNKRTPNDHLKLIFNEGIHWEISFYGGKKKRKLIFKKHTGWII